MRRNLILLVGLLAATTAFGQLTNGVPTGYAILLVKTNVNMNALLHPSEMITNGMDSSGLTGCPSGAVPTNRIITINGVDHTLDFNRAWTIDCVSNGAVTINGESITNGGVYTLSGTGAVSSAQATNIAENVSAAAMATGNCATATSATTVTGAQSNLIASALQSEADTNALAQLVIETNRAQVAEALLVPKAATNGWEVGSHAGLATGMPVYVESDPVFATNGVKRSDTNGAEWGSHSDLYPRSNPSNWITLAQVPAQTTQVYVAQAGTAQVAVVATTATDPTARASASNAQARADLGLTNQTDIVITLNNTTPLTATCTPGRAHQIIAPGTGAVTIAFSDWPTDRTEQAAVYLEITNLCTVIEPTGCGTFTNGIFSSNAPIRSKFNDGVYIHSNRKFYSFWMYATTPMGAPTP